MVPNLDTRVRIRLATQKKRRAGQSNKKLHLFILILVFYIPLNIFYLL